jgi:hypothetical protein
MQLFAIDVVPTTIAYVEDALLEFSLDDIDDI